MIDKVYFTMVLHPLEGWIRVGNSYSTKDNAKGWLPFVKSAWRGCKVKVSTCTLKWDGNKLTQKTIEKLDKKFNIDATEFMLKNEG